MATVTTIARPYAKAAFAYAVESNTMNAWSYFLKKAELIVEDPRVKALLVNPKFSTDQKCEFLESLFGDELNSGMNNYLKTIAHYKRFMVIPAIGQLFEVLKREQEKIIEVDVVTAHGLDKAMEKQLQQALSIRLQKEVQLKVEINDTLIGGAVIRAGDFVIDGSSKGKLQRLQKLLEA